MQLIKRFHRGSCGSLRRPLLLRTCGLASITLVPLILILSLVTTPITANSPLGFLHLPDSVSQTLNHKNIHPSQLPFSSAHNIWTLFLLNNTLIKSNAVGTSSSLEPDHFLYDPINGLLYVSEQATNTVAVINLTTFSVVANISVGTYPEGMLLDPVTHDIYVANVGYHNNSNNISVVDPNTNRVVQSVTVGTGPWMLTYDPQTREIFSANSGSYNVSIINASTNQVIGNVAVGTVPYGIVYDPASNDVFVANDHSDNVSVINASSDRVLKTLSVGHIPAETWLDSLNGNIYIPDWGSQNVTVIDGLNATVLPPISTGSLPQGATNDPNDMVYVTNSGSNNVTAINGSNNQVAYSFPVGNHPDDIVYVARTNSLFVANMFSDSVSIVFLSSAPPLWTNLAFDGPSSGYGPLTVTMTANASGAVAPYYYAWSFGDGTSGTGTTVTHTFPYLSTCSSVNINGDCIYQVLVTTTASNGDTASASGTVTVVNPNGNSSLLVSFITFATPTIGYAPLLVTMSGQAHGGTSPYTFSWDFGDGATAIGTTVSHVYQNTSVGCNSTGCTFTITLTAHDSGGHFATSTAQVTLYTTTQRTFAVTMADSPATGIAPLGVNLTASAAGGASPYTFVWAFGDGTTGLGWNTHHQYNKTGTYMVVLTAIDARGSIAQTTSTILVSPSPGGNQSGAIEIAISGSPLTGPAPLTSELTASAVGGQPPYSYSWNFGDGTATALGSAVSHTFLNPGEYVVSLLVNDSKGNEAVSGPDFDTNGVTVLADISGSEHPPFVMLASRGGLPLHLGHIEPRPALRELLDL